MNQVLLLSKFFFKELVYRKIFFVALGIGLAFVVLSMLLGPLSYSEESRLAINFSLAGSQIALIFLSVLVGADFIKSDIESQAIHSFLARPITRFQYYFAKFLAFAFCLLFLTVVMWAGLFTIGLIIGTEDSLMSLIPYVGIYIESMILFSFALMVSLFSSSLMAVGASFTLFLVGHWVEIFKFLSEKSASFIIKTFGMILTKLIPNLESLNWKSDLTYGDWEPAINYLRFSSYGLSWVFFLMLIGYFVFSKKDFS